MHNQHKINEVLDALGDRTLSTDEIIPKLKEYRPTRRQLAALINGYMVGRYVEKYRDFTGTPRVNKFRVIAW